MSPPWFLADLPLIPLVLHSHCLFHGVCVCPIIPQSMVMQKKLRKVISYVARIQDFPLKGTSRSKGRKSTITMDAALLKWFRTIPGVSSEVGR